MSWRFYPLAQYPLTGIIIHSDERKRTPFPAEFLTLDAARNRVARKLTDQREGNAE